MEKRLLIVFIIISAFVIMSTDSKSRKRRQAPSSSLRRSSVKEEQCFTEKCLGAKRRARSISRSPSTKTAKRMKREVPAQKTTAKPAKPKQPVVQKPKPTPKPVKPKQPAQKPKSTQKPATPKQPAAQKPKPTPNSAKQQGTTTKPKQQVEPKTAGEPKVESPKVESPKALENPLKPNLRTDLAHLEAVELERRWEELAKPVVKPAEKEEHHPHQLYISKLFIEEKPEPRDLSYKRPLRETDRDDDQLPPGERELTIKDLEDRVVTTDFARKKHFIELDQALGLRRAVMALLFVIIVMPATLFFLIHCCSKRPPKEKKTEEEKFMESLMSKPLLSPIPSGVNSNNSSYYQGDSKYRYQSTYPTPSSPNSTAVTVFVPPV